MQPLPRVPARRSLLTLGAAALGLAGATVAAALLESGPLGIRDAAPIYIVPVVIMATRFGSRAGVATSLASLLVYDFLFTTPRFSLAVADPNELLDLVLFLFIAVVVGRLSAIGLERANLAEVRARESLAQFAVSRLPATEELDQAIPASLARIAQDAGVTRAWITVDGPSSARTLADTQAGQPTPARRSWTSLPARRAMSRPAGSGPTRRRRVRGRKPARPACGSASRPRARRSDPSGQSAGVGRRVASRPACWPSSPTSSGSPSIESSSGRRRR